LLDVFTGKCLASFITVCRSQAPVPISGRCPQLEPEGDAEETTRQKSGIALRFPLILRWWLDKPKEDADMLDSLKALLAE